MQGQMDAVGKELDAEVAEKVMGYRWRSRVVSRTTTRRRYLADGDWASDELATGAEEPFSDAISMVPPYSTNIASAWAVVSEVGLSILRLPDGKWWAGKLAASTYFNEYGNIDGELWPYAEADTAPLAICLAALKVVGAEMDIEESGKIIVDHLLKETAKMRQEEAWGEDSLRIIISAGTRKREIEGPFQLCGSRRDLERIVRCIEATLAAADQRAHFSYGWVDIVASVPSVQGPPEQWE